MAAVDPLTAGAVLLATAATDAVYVMFTSAVVARKRVPAATWSSIWYLLSSFAVISYTDNWAYVAFAAIGSWIGAYASLTFLHRPPGGGSPLGASPVTALEGFPTRAELVERYERRSGRAVGALDWFEALALWKAAVFCEAIYGRFTRGELGAEDARAAAFEQAVPRMAEAAAERLDEVERTA